MSLPPCNSNPFLWAQQGKLIYPGSEAVKRGPERPQRLSRTNRSTEIIAFGAAVTDAPQLGCQPPVLDSDRILGFTLKITPEDVNPGEQWLPDEYLPGNIVNVTLNDRIVAVAPCDVSPGDQVFVEAGTGLPAATGIPAYGCTWERTAMAGGLSVIQVNTRPQWNQYRGTFPPYGIAVSIGGAWGQSILPDRVAYVDVSNIFLTDQAIQGDLTITGLAELAACNVDGSPVRTMANTPDAVATFPPAGIPVSDGTAWGTSIDPRTVARLDPAWNYHLAVASNIYAMGNDGEAFSLLSTETGVRIGNTKSGHPAVQWLIGSAGTDMHIWSAYVTNTAFYLSADTDTGSNWYWLAVTRTTGGGEPQLVQIYPPLQAMSTLIVAGATLFESSLDVEGTSFLGNGLTVSGEYPTVLNTPLQVMADALFNGVVTLAGDPENPLEAATKQYVDANAGGDTSNYALLDAANTFTQPITISQSGYSGLLLRTTVNNGAGIIQYETPTQQWQTGAGGSGALERSAVADCWYIWNITTANDVVLRLDPTGNLFLPHGSLTLAADPTQPLQAATKQYVDAHGGALPANVALLDAANTFTATQTMTGLLVGIASSTYRLHVVDGFNAQARLETTSNYGAAVIQLVAPGIGVEFGLGSKASTNANADAFYVYNTIEGGMMMMVARTTGNARFAGSLSVGGGYFSDLGKVVTPTTTIDAAGNAKFLTATANSFMSGTTDSSYRFNVVDATNKQLNIGTSSTTSAAALGLTTPSTAVEIGLGSPNGTVANKDAFYIYNRTGSAFLMTLQRANGNARFAGGLSLGGGGFVSGNEKATPTPTAVIDAAGNAAFVTVTLAADPATALQAATKQYVDAQIAAMATSLRKNTKEN